MGIWFEAVCLVNAVNVDKLVAKAAWTQEVACFCLSDVILSASSEGLSS